MDLLNNVEKYNKRHRRRKHWQQLVSVLGCIVVFCTTYALILPAITLEKDVYCGLEEHTHTEDCYAEIIEMAGNGTEQDADTEGSLALSTVAKPEATVPFSNENINSVSDGDPDVVSDGDNDDYTEATLTCTLEENEDHAHTFLCYGNWELICELEEHTHELICHSDPTADVETTEDWEAAFANITLTGVRAEDVVAIAETQLGYMESTKNYTVLEDGETTRGYTRYGEWYGDPYGDWNAMFASFCLYYAGIEEMPLDSDCESWVTALSSEEYSLYEATADHTVQTGELIFFDLDGDAAADRVGIIAKLVPAEGDTSAQIQVIEGDSDRLVRYVTYKQSDEQIIGFSLLPGNPLDARPEKVQRVIDLIDAMPSADEIDAKLAEYEEAEDYEGEEAYYTQVVQQVCDVYFEYCLLTSAEKALVTNADKLMELEYIWSAATLIDEITSDKPTTVAAASTSDFIDLNLYDYGSNLNILYNSNSKYPGFQWNGGAYLKSTYNRHVVDYIDFGNSMITDLTYGSSGSESANGYSSNRKLVGNKGGAINALDVSDYGVTNRPIGMSLNSSITDTTNDVLSRTLGSDGYPALTDGTSLSYLFQNGTYATKKNTASIDGLFQQNSVSGEYHYNSRINHAQYSNNKFTLYNQIITPNFIVYPFGNFLPFNDITSGSNATQVSKITKLGSNGYMQHVINDLVYASDYNSNTTKQQLVDMLAKYRNDLQGGDAATNSTDPWATWSAADAINDYFRDTNADSDNPSSRVNFSMSDALLKKMYNIDYDIATNFFFGMDMSMNFIQPKGGMTGNDTNGDGESDYEMIFYFTGDDDVWVYIDGVLFLDLSGIHRHVGGEIDFVNGKVNYYYLDTANTGDVSTTPYQTYTFAEILKAAGKSTDGLNANGTFKDYTSHQFKFYYMERGSGSSVCRLNFNFPLLRKNMISISKELSNDSNTLGNPDFLFQILKADSKGNKTNELFIGANAEYTVYNANNNVVRTAKTDANGVITLKAGERAEFTDISEDKGKYYVRELLDDSFIGQYDQITVSGESTTKNNNVTVGNDTFTGVESPVKDMSNGSTSFRFDNKVDTGKLGTLSIKKVVDEYNQSSDNNDTFEFAVTLDGNPLPEGTTYKVGDTGYTVSVVKDNNKVTASYVTLHKGETAVISNILGGTAFTVQETSGSSEGYTVLYSEDPNDTAAGNVVTTDGTMAAGTITYSATVGVVITNTEKGATVTIPGNKSLYSYDSSKHEYTFSLEQVTDKTGSTLVENGTNLTATVDVQNQAVPFSFALSYRQYQVTSLPQIYYYRIYESSIDSNTLTNNQVYIVEVTVSNDNNGGIQANLTNMWSGAMDTAKQINTASLTEVTDPFSADFINTLASDLIISKTVSGNTAALVQEFEFEITLEDGDSGISPDNRTYSAVKTADGAETQTFITFTGKLSTIKLKSGESFRITDLPYGTKWTVTETNSGGFKVAYSQTGSCSVDEGFGNSTDGTIVLGDNSVAFVNTMFYELPETGGSGTNRYIAGGLLLTILAAILLLYNNKIKKGYFIMKKMKRIASLILAVVMVFTMTLTSFAAEGDDTDAGNTGSNVTTGTITIDNAVVGQTYTVYQILDLESYNAAAGAYAYKAATTWNAFINSATIQGIYVNVDDQGYVTWVEGADAAKFAQLAKEYAAFSKIDAQGTQTATTEDEEATITKVEFTGLDLGYYLVDSTLGTLCSLDTTNPIVTIQEKNEAPTIEKEVQEDSDNSWGETNDADINQTVNFQATITVQEGAENYILHDTMSTGLTYTDVTSVKIGDAAVAENNYKVTAPGTCGCTFEVAFDNDYIATLDAGTKIVVAYSATLNENAVVGLEGNPNTVKLQYGDEAQPSYTPEDKTITYTWDMNVVKYTTNKDDEVKLEGATFKLSTDEAGENVLKFHALGNNLYEVCADAECTKEHVTEITTDSTGTFKIEGIDAGTYYLTETAAPAGYNKLAGPTTVTITGAVKGEDDTLSYTTVETKVLNNTGTKLPETGGMGTTLFYIFGCILVLAAVVLLITRKRMSSLED